IVGNNSGNLTDNYYRCCTVGSQTSDIGCNGSDCNGARGVYTVTTPNDVTASGNKTIEIGGEDYFIAGITIVTLTNEPLATGYKYHYAYSYPGSSVIAVDGNSFLMPSSDTEVTTIICRTIEVTGYEDGSDKWAFIASPSSDPQPVVAVEGLLGETISYNPLTYNYDLYRLNPSSMLWENYHQHYDFTSLTNGKGYLYATKETKTIAFPEPFNTADSQEVTLEQGWNLVGNPFEVDAYVNRAFYKMNAEGTGIEPVIANFDEYVPTKIPACTGIVVQAANANETVTFSKVAPTNTAANQGHITIALIQANTRDNSTLDKAIVNFNEGSQLGKFYFGEQNANIYIPRNHDDYAIINSDRRSDVDVHFKAKEFGRYTISFECENTDINGMKLIDLFTDNIIDLSENPSYTFTGSPADRAARFKLVFNNVSEENDIFAYQNGDDIIVDGEGELQVFDVMGRLVANQRINGVETIAKPEQAGIYILKMNEKTQKIIVR
ncbi:MAG: T9SS type A sorting domain-containing protein, partial [Bacteroidales bacterium]|nr:T9SS type A sorting domain-containing protein [Bacteroidales bacterium]